MFLSWAVVGWLEACALAIACTYTQTCNIWIQTFLFQNLMPLRNPCACHIPTVQALADRQAILDFLEAGAAVLSVQAGSAEDVQRAGAEAHALVKRLGDVPRVCAAQCAPGHARRYSINICVAVCL